MNYYAPMQYGMGMQQYNPSPIIQPPQINGKIVDGEDVVRATEVPINSYGVFPKADLSSIYIKTWNTDGTTKIITYAPTVTEQTPKSIALDDIYKAIDDINKKIDNLKPTPAPKRRREVDDDEQ